MRSFVTDHPKQFSSFKAELFETCLSALELLRSDGDVDKNLLLMFSVSDVEPDAATELRRMKRLNPGSNAISELTRWLKTWDE